MAEHIAKAKIDLGLDEIKQKLGEIIDQIKEVHEQATKHAPLAGLTGQQAEEAERTIEKYKELIGAINETANAEKRKQEILRQSISLGDERVRRLAEKEQALSDAIVAASEAYEVSIGSVRKAVNVIEQSAKSYDEADAAAKEYARTIREKVARSYEEADAEAQAYNAELKRQKQAMLDMYKATALTVQSLRKIAQGEELAGAEALKFNHAIRQTHRDLAKLESAGLSVMGLRNGLFEAQAQAEKTRREAQALRNELKAVARAEKAMNQHTKESIGLWERFGKAAVVFTLFYRGINAVEDGMRRMVETIKEGITYTAEFGEIRAKMALWGTMFESNAENFADAFAKARVNIVALQKELPRTTTSIADISQGLDELAQHGIFATEEMMPKIVKFIDLVNMVAKNSTMSANQIRQEFNALFEGNVRAGNSLLYVLRNLGGDAEKLRKEIKAGYNVTENFLKILDIMTPQVEQFRKAIFGTSSTAAFESWNRQIKVLIASSVELASASEKVNIFAKVLNKHKEALVGNETFTERWAGVMRDLAKVLDWVLDAAERYLEYLPGIIQLVKEHASAMLQLSAAYFTARTAISAFMKISVAKKLTDLISPLALYTTLTLAAAYGFDKLSESVDAFHHKQERYAKTYDSFIKNHVNQFPEVVANMQRTVKNIVADTGDEVEAKYQAVKEYLEKNGNLAKYIIKGDDDKGAVGVISNFQNVIFDRLTNSIVDSLRRAGERIKIEMDNLEKNVGDGLVGVVSGDKKKELSDTVIAKLTSKLQKLKNTLYVSKEADDYQQKINKIIVKYRELEKEGVRIAQEAPQLFAQYFGSMQEFLTAIWRSASNEQAKIADEYVAQVEEAEKKALSLTKQYQEEIGINAEDQLKSQLKANELWLEQQYQKIEALEQLGLSTEKVNLLIEQAGEAFDTMNKKANWSFVEKQAKQAGKSFASTTKYMKDLWTLAMNDMRNATKQLFVDVIKGNFKDIGKSFENMITNMIANWLSMQMQMALFGNTAGELGGLIGAAAKGIGNWFTSEGGLFGASMIDVVANDYTGYGIDMYGMHSGGKVGLDSSFVRRMPVSLLSGAPRLHNGLASDEYPTILQRGEEVVPAGESKRGVTVNVFEAPGTTTEVRQKDNGSGGLTLDVIIKQVEDKISTNVGLGRGTLGRTLEQTYGLNKAVGAYR